MHFRRFRIGVLLVVLAGVAALLYLNRVGLPDFVKRPLLEKLHARGIDLQFTRLRWRPVYGIVADNVSFGQTNGLAGPKLMLKEIQVRLNYPALLKREVQVKSLALHNGRLVWTIPDRDTNNPPREISAQNIETELQLLTNDVWSLEDFQAQFAGATVQLSGAITNASVVRDWKIFHRGRSAPGALQERLRRIADILEQTHFSTAPQLKLDIRGDARNLENLSVRLTADAPGAVTPWGTWQRGLLTIRSVPGSGTQPSHAEVNLRAASAQTQWANATNVSLNVHLFSADAETNLVRAELNLSAASVQTPQGGATNIQFTAQWMHSLTNPIPVSGGGELLADNPQTKWGRAASVNIKATLFPTTNAVQPDASWAWWAKFAPYSLDLDCHVLGLNSPKLTTQEIFCSAQWRAPELTVTKLSSRLYGGQLDATAGLDVTTRKLVFNASSDFDAQKISPLLTPGAQDWLANYSWNKPPHLKADGSLVLPAWTNRHPDWRGEVRPSVVLNGEFHIQDGAFRGVTVATADSHFTYTNMFWLLPDIVATRPEGRIELFHRANDRTKDYYFRIHSTIDPRGLAPLVPEDKREKALSILNFTQPPVIDGEVWGRWHNHDLIHGHARVAATNFTMRGQAADVAYANCEYTNGFLLVTDPHVYTGTQYMTADSVGVDFRARKVYLTNGIGQFDPRAVARAIGPRIGKHMEPYEFLEPPRAHVEGVIPMHDVRDGDLHFNVNAGALRIWHLTVPSVIGKVDWVGEHLTFRDVETPFYYGKGVGDADFDFTRDHGVDFRFNVAITDANVHFLAEDLKTTTKTNKLEGLLTARVSVTNAYSGDWQTWQGMGRANLRDGLIWDIPIFGIFSPVLDAIMPGLGSSRAREATATFVITNGVARTDDLEIHTTMARLLYRGTIDMKANVDAHVQAELLRNTPMVGPVLSLALWPVSKVFEYKISGSLHHPKSEPVYLPKFFFMPLHPMQTWKDLVPSDSGSTETNTPNFAPLPGE